MLIILVTINCNNIWFEVIIMVLVLDVLICICLWWKMCCKKASGWSSRYPFCSLFIPDDLVDQDSRFAKSLGFYEDAPWNLNYNATSERLDGQHPDVRELHSFHSIHSIYYYYHYDNNWLTRLTLKAVSNCLYYLYMYEGISLVIARNIL